MIGGEIAGGVEDPPIGFFEFVHVESCRPFFEETFLHRVKSHCPKRLLGRRDGEAILDCIFTGDEDRKCFSVLIFL